MRKLALTLVGGFCGAITRYLLSAPLLALTAGAPGSGKAFPYDILLINLSGALLLGLLFGLFEHGAPISPDVRLSLGTGFLGAYTTFSSYMVGADQQFVHGNALAGILYVVGSMAGGVTLAFAGFWVAGALWRGWRSLSAVSVSDELLLDGGWDGRPSDTLRPREERERSLPSTGAGGERVSR